jgi:hypothetical protein
MGHKLLTKRDAHPQGGRPDAGGHPLQHRGHGACVRLLKPAMNCAKVSLLQEQIAT